jgi:iron(II)-dependent oxidoreductase
MSSAQLASLDVASLFQIALVHVPAGEFLMGSDPARDSFAQPDERPMHTVKLSGFYLGKYEVTNIQFAAYARANDVAYKFDSGARDHPAVHISWHEALAFCDWVAHLTGQPATLPTEAQWEKAARGTGARLYPWGDTWDATRLHCGLDGAGATKPASRFSPAGDSPYGVADMAGNVWEWIADWYDGATYAHRAGHLAGHWIEDPRGPETGTHRVLRGGSSFFRQSGTRAARRHKYIPQSRCYDIGFRIAVCADAL